MGTAKPSEEATLSVIEITAQIRAMSVADKIRLVRSSNYLSFGGARSPADLRQEAIRRAIGGTRKCPRELPLITFLRGAMRSIAWADRRSLARAAKIQSAPNSGPVTGGDSDFSDPRQSAEDQILQQDRITEIKERILGLFADDAAAYLLAEGMMEGKQGTELRELLELSETEFASKRRLVRRRIDAAFPKGWRP